MKKLSLAYFGTPQIAADVLKELLMNTSLPIEIKLVVTQPDKPVGKKQLLTPSHTKVLAEEHRIPVYDKSAKSQELIKMLKDNSIDIVLLFAYGEIITQELLNIPRLGFWNIHPSLLPLYRGASPIAYPLLLGDTVTGVSLMQMDAELDHGGIIFQEKINIDIKDTQSDLEKKLTSKAIQIVKDQLKKVGQLESSLPVMQQNHTLATFSRRLHKNDGYIPFQALKDALNGKENNFIPQIIQNYYEKNKNIHSSNYSLATMIYNLYRGFYAWPGIWTKVTIHGVEKRLKITDVSLTENKLSINKVQLEGKNEVDFNTFNSAYSLF